MTEAGITAVEIPRQANCDRAVLSRMNAGSAGRLSSRGFEPVILSAVLSAATQAVVGQLS
jgi:hypothetical protein